MTTHVEETPMGACDPTRDGCVAARDLVSRERAAREKSVEGLYEHMNHGFDRMQASIDGLRVWLMGSLAAVALAAVGWVVSLLR